jgi:hypothetical protein
MGVDCTRGFKEQHWHSVCNYVLDFTGVTFTPTQMYNHMTKLILRWAMVCKVKNVLEWDILQRKLCHHDGQGAAKVTPHGVVCI